MPTYVYRNLVTNETFEQEQRITEDALTVDPRTGDPVKRLIQPVGIAFKGSGFYVNDSRSSKKSSTKSATGAAEATSSDGASGSETAKPSDSGTASGGSAATTSTPSTASTAASGTTTPAAG